MYSAPIRSSSTTTTMNSVPIRNNTLLMKAMSPKSNHFQAVHHAPKSEWTSKRKEPIGLGALPQRKRKEPIGLGAPTQRKGKRLLYSIPEDRSECLALKLEIRNDDDHCMGMVRRHRRNAAMDATTLGNVIQQVNKLDRRHRRNHGVCASSLGELFHAANCRELAVDGVLPAM